MVDIKNIPAELKTSCRFCVWKFEKRNGQKTKMPYNPANGDRARINDLRTFADFKTTLVTYAMGGYDGIGIAVGSGIGAFDIDHCIREDGTLNDTADTVLSIFPTAYVEKSPSGKGLRGFFHVPEDYVYDKTVYYINNRSTIRIWMMRLSSHMPAKPVTPKSSKSSLPVSGKTSTAASRMQIWRSCLSWHSGAAVMRSRWIVSSVHLV